MASKKILDSVLCPICGGEVLFSKDLVFGAKGILCHWDCIRDYLGEAGFVLTDKYPKIQNSADFKNYLETVLQISVIMLYDESHVKVQSIIQKYSNVFDFLGFNDVEIYQLVKECTEDFCAPL